MSYVAVEYDNGVNNTHVLGSLRVPDQFHPLWSFGFRSYLTDKYKVTGEVKIYPLRVRETPDNMGNGPLGYTDMRDDFSLALRSNNYYPECATTNSIRRQWSTLDPKSPDYMIVETV